jgi:hypothetical protein
VCAVRSGAVTLEKLFPSGAPPLHHALFSQTHTPLDALSFSPLPFSEIDSYANERLPETWTPTAEVVNGRVAMIAMGLLLLEELVTGRAVF